MKDHNISDVRALEQYYVGRVLQLAASAGVSLNKASMLLRRFAATPVMSARTGAVPQLRPPASCAGWSAPALQVALIFGHIAVECCDAI